MILAPGTRLGPYEVQGSLGAGGMGEVYRAHDPRLGRDVALKILPAPLAVDAELRSRFTREARAVAALNHRNVVTIHEIGDAGARPYIAFELIEGETLRHRLAGGPMTEADALAIAIQVAEGLAHAHAAGVVHRDLKPGNIMVRPDGQVKILDFGLGKFLVPSRSMAEAATTLPSVGTAPGAIMGTPGYTAPEIIRGEAVDARADQFAFGAVLYELLTGRRAFDRGSVVQTLNATVEDEPPPLRKAAPRVSERTAAIVERCLSKRAHSRFPTTGDLVAALRAAAVDAATISAAGRARAWVTRRAGVIVLSAAALALVAAGAVTGIWNRVPGAATVRAAERRIVVLPFRNVGGDDATQPFVDGLVELLTTNLAQLEQFDPTLLVVPATEVRRDPVRSARDALRAFRAALAVSGSVLRAGDRVRLTIDLIDVSTLEQLDGRTIDGGTGDILALQDAAVAALAAMLEVELQPQQARRGSTSGAPVAYDYYVQGRGYLQRFERVESVDSAIELFTRAIAADARFALAHAALGEAYWRKYELTKDPDLVTRARAATSDAVRLDPDNAAVHLTSGIVARGTGEYETAVAELQRALSLDPASGDAYRELGRAYEAQQRYDLAEAAYRKGIEVRPGDWAGYGALGRFFHARNRYEDALAEFQHVTELTPDNAAAFSNVGGIQYLLGRHDEAAASWERSVAIQPTVAALSNLGKLYFDRGRFAEAAGAYERALALNGNDYRVWGYLGAAYQRVPDAAKMRSAFERALAVVEKELAVNPRRAIVFADASDYLQMLGRTADAQRYVENALRLAPDDSRVLFKVAMTSEALGDRGRALELLGRALGAGLPRQEVDQSRALAQLRTDPRFAALMAARPAPYRQ